MFRTLEITSPLLKRPGNCKQFLIVDLVVDLMLIHLSRMKSNRVQATFNLLRQYSSDYEIRSITFNDALELRVEVSKYWSRGKSRLQLLEGDLTLPARIKLLRLLCQVGQRPSELRIALN